MATNLTRKVLSVWGMLLLFSLAPSPLKAATSARGFLSLRREVFNGSSIRGYYVRYPRRYRKPFQGMIVALHGLKGPLEFRRCDRQRLEELAGHERYITVYPEARSDCWNSPAQKVGFAADRTAVLELIAFLQKKHAIDSQQIFLVGSGPGARLAQEIRDTRPDLVRALAMVAMGGPKKIDRPTIPGTVEQPVPTVWIRGSLDPYVPYRGGATRIPGWPSIPVAGAWDTLESEGKRAQCASKIEIRSLPDKKRKDTLRVRRARAHSCRADSEYVLYEFFGGGHAWPGCSRYHRSSQEGAVSLEYSATEILWDFFLRHGLRRARPLRTVWEAPRLKPAYYTNGGDPLWYRKDPRPNGPFRAYELGN